MNAVDFKAGVAVHCKDGQRGTLAKVIVEPKSQVVTDLIVEPGQPTGHARVLPVSLVESATQDAILLAISGDEFERFSEYHRFEEDSSASTYFSSAPRQRNGELLLRDAYYCAIRPAPPVLTLREKLRRWKARPRRIPAEVATPGVEPAGRRSLWIDADDDEVTHCVVRQGVIFTDQLVIPVFFVKDLGDDDLAFGGDSSLNKTTDFPLYFEQESYARPYWREPRPRQETGLPA
jgi:hypothetical protein